MKTCKKNVYQGRFMGFKPCKRKAVKDGFCKQHNPEAGKERQERSAKLRDHKFRIMFSDPIPDGWKLVPVEPTVAEAVVCVGVDALEWLYRALQSHASRCADTGENMRRILFEIKKFIWWHLFGKIILDPAKGNINGTLKIYGLKKSPVDVKKDK